MVEGPERFDLLDLDGPAWVRLEGGVFEMGSDDGEKGERPVHTVRLSPFLISRYPVTNAQYSAFVEDTGRQPPRHWDGRKIPEGKAEHPVVWVSLSEADAFCDWLTKQIGERSEKAHLPTEAQWEFAARGTEGRLYPWGSHQPTPEHANYKETGIDDTSPVGSYPKGVTPDGVHDLAGNVYEWCRDWYGSYPENVEPPPQDPTGPTTGLTRVLRGGSFDLIPRYLRGADRYADPGSRGGYRGFRVAWDGSGGLEN